jgi:hypothetical protein
LHQGVVQPAGWISADGVRIAVDSGQIAPGTEVLWSIRPERVSLLPVGGLAGTFIDIADVGTAVDLFIALSPHLEIHARTTQVVEAGVGDACHVELPADAITLWPAVATAGATTS